MDEHLVAIVSFEGALKREIKRVREMLKECDDIPTFKLSFEAKGRVNDGEIKLQYTVCPNEYGADTVTGDDLNACIEEMLRRHGWTKRHSPKALAYHKIPSDDTADVTPCPNGNGAGEEISF